MNDLGWYSGTDHTHMNYGGNLHNTPANMMFVGEAEDLNVLADKICNLRDMAQQPPAEWDLSRKQEYFDWAKAVVDGLRGTSASLEAAFDKAYAMKPAP